MELPTLPITTYHCTISPKCRFSTPTFEDWKSHEITSHPITAHNFWLCHCTPSFPECTCNLAFSARTDFEKHWFDTHPKDEAKNPRPLRYGEYFLGPEADQVFWCGFCRKVFSCYMTRTWMIDRFEHVAAHFQTWHATWNHFEIKDWQYSDFWVAPAPVTEDVAKADGNTEVIEEGVQISGRAKHVKHAKKSKVGKDTNKTNLVTVGNTEKVEKNAGTPDVAV